MMNKHLLLSILFILTCTTISPVCTSILQARIVHVPGDEFLTIQGAINRCFDGDTVLVANGTYTGEGNRDIDFTGKAIVVMSENGPENCIIDCEEAGRGFYFHNGEDSNSVLQGFTITNGASSKGGCIACMSSSPTISDNIITGCTAYAAWLSGAGGGIYCEASSPTILRNVITGNESNEGGGIFCTESSPTITGNTITGNAALRPFDGGTGGGIDCKLSSPVITGNTITENYAGWGAGISLFSSSATVTGNTIAGNTASDTGGGLCCLNESPPTITNSIFWGNSPDEINCGSADPIVEYSDIEDGWIGEGNIDADPLFVTFHGFDYLLHPSSPCVDAGDPSIEDGLYDWHPRWPDWYPNSSRSDMGAYGGPENMNWLP
jgi:hypothetical protein